MARRWADATGHWLKKDNLERLLGRLGWAHVIADMGTTLALLRRGGDRPPDFVEQVLFSLHNVRAALDGVANSAASAPDCLWNDLMRDAASNPAHSAALSMLASRHLRARGSTGPRIELDWFNARGARPFVGDVVQLLLGPSAGYVISVGDAVAVWRTSDRRITHFLRSGKKTTAACLLPHGRGLATAAGKTVELWDLNTGEISDAFEVRDDVDFLASRGDDLVILTATSGAVHRGAPPFDEVWSWQWKGVDPKNAVYDGPRQTAFCPTRTEGIVAIRLESRSYVQINPSPGHTMEALALTSQGLVTGDDEGHIRVLSLAPPHAELRHGKITSVADCLQVIRHGIPSGRGSKGGKAKIRFEGQLPRVELTGMDPSWIRCVAVSPDEQLVAVGGHDGFVRILDAATLNQKAETDLDVGACMLFVGPRSLWASAVLACVSPAAA
jgi:hypothetical protein